MYKPTRDRESDPRRSSIRLRDELQRWIGDWKEDLTLQWRKVLSPVELDFSSLTLDHEFGPDHIIVPARAQLLRAFDGTDPGGVRAVLLGQDPYPNPAWATGRAFEQGNLDEWPQERHMVAHSLARIVQTLAYARSRRKENVAGDRGWSAVILDLRMGRLFLPPPRELFDHLERHGVLLLNASLTLSFARSGKQRRSHFAVWHPLVCRVLTHLATRRHGYIVFLLWGNRAAEVFRKAGVQAAAEQAGTWKTRADAAGHFHPAAITREGAAFLSNPNPFLQANQILERMGAKPIEW